MSNKKAMQYAESPAGRCYLHAVAASKDRRYGWHLRGMTREVRQLCRDAAESARQLCEVAR